MEDAMAIYDEWENTYRDLIEMTTEEYEQHKAEFKKFAEPYKPGTKTSVAKQL
jgi:hypothetical protein